MTTITVAATQMSCSWDREANLKKAEALVCEAAAQGAEVILLQELFETPYFCPDQKQELFALAKPYKDNPLLARFSELASNLRVVLPISFFERDHNAYFNSLCWLDADGRALGLYRKSHIPQGPGYQEKFYFSPGDSGFTVVDTRFGRLGAGICWDQWFPETARCLALQGAEVIFFPTAIGSEPQDPTLNSRDHWQRAMQGHAASNCTPVVAANRVGREQADSAELRFYGASFITDETGAKLAEAGEEDETVITATFEREALHAFRASWGLFRDRRPDLYKPLLTTSGRQDALD